MQDWSNVADALAREIRVAEKPIMMIDRGSVHRELAQALTTKVRPVAAIPPYEVNILRETHGTLIIVAGDQCDDGFFRVLCTFVPMQVIIICGATIPDVVTGLTTRRECPVDPGDGRLIVFT